MADRCWRCATEISVDDVFCPACGARVSEAGLDLEPPTEVVEHTPPPPVEATESAGSRWPLVVGLSLVAAVVAFFVATSDGADDTPSADPFEERSDFERTDDIIGDTTTTTTVATFFPEIIEPLTWTVEREDVPGFALATIEHGDSTFVYSSESPFGWIAGAGGTTVSKRTAAGDWIDHGEIFAADSVTRAVIATGDDRFLATGLDPDGRPTVWRSDDGIEWAPEELPATSLGSNVRLVPVAMIEKDGVILVAGAADNPWTTISEVVRERFADLGAMAQPSWSSLDEEVVLVQGPFGLILDEIPLAELGIEVVDMVGGPVRHPAPVWIFEDGTWHSDLVGGDVTGLMVSPEEPGILVSAASNTGVEVVRFVDGGWEDVASGSGLWDIRSGPDGAPMSLLDRTLTVRDRELEPVRDIALPLDPEADVSGWGVSEHGVAVASGMWFDATATTESERLTLRSDGYRLTTDGSDLLLSVVDGTVLFRIDAWSGEPDPGYRIDLDDQTVVFLNPVSGTELARFSIADVGALDATTEHGNRIGTQDLAVYVSPDAERWFGGAIGEIDGGALIQLDVGESVLRLTIVSATDPNRGFWEAASLRSTTMTAPIPSG